MEIDKRKIERQDIRVSVERSHVARCRKDHLHSQIKYQMSTQRITQ